MAFQAREGFKTNNVNGSDYGLLLIFFTLYLFQQLSTWSKSNNHNLFLVLICVILCKFGRKRLKERIGGSCI